MDAVHVPAVEAGHGVALVGAEGDDAVGGCNQFLFYFLALQRFPLAGAGLHLDAGKGVEGDDVGNVQPPAESLSHPARKPVVGVDGAVGQPVAPGKSLHFRQEAGQQVEEVVHGGIRLAGRQVGDPGVGGDVLNHSPRPRPRAVLPGKNVHVHAGIAQCTGQLPDVHVHAPSLALARRGQGAGVEGYKGYSCFVQLWPTAQGLVTTMWYMVRLRPPRWYL